MEHGNEAPAWVAMAGIALLAAVHLFAARLRFIHVIPRSRWLSMAGGASVAYVFLHLFPELADYQTSLRENLPPSLGWIEHHIYIIALLGLAAFYGLERMARQSRGKASTPGQEGGSCTPMPVFWLHILSFAIYNLLIGYFSIHLEENSPRGMFAFFVAMALHFLVNDFGLAEYHKAEYRKKGRWVVAGAVALGGIVGWAVQIPEVALYSLMAFVAGGVILNVLKEELPEERESRFSAFLLGAAVYSAVLLFA